MDKRALHTELFALLREWCDALIGLQVDMPPQSALDGGILCPACGMIHGRCVDAVYPLLFMADRTGEDRYRTAAERLFSWSSNMRCPDGSMRNDFKSPWRGVTVFYAVALHDALAFHGGVLSDRTREVWQTRLREMGEWLFTHLTVGAKAYINYYAANACAMALLGCYFGKPEYHALARELAAYCLRHVSENGLLYGEGMPHDAHSAKGCRAIDAGGYNAEETLPMLTRCAQVLSDANALAACKKLWRAHLDWMTPDGAWDNSVGTRAFKWTYWGSRTSDGCQEALFSLGRDDAVFAEAAYRNFTLLRSCTHGGLLHGGRDCAAHGILPCVHHTFCHAKAIAGALNADAPAISRVPLPADAPDALRYYPETDTYRLSCGDWRADVTAYDFPHRRGDHASGGALSFLWHRVCGPIIACGMVDFALVETMNQQLPPDENALCCPCPRIEVQKDGIRYAQHYDFGAVMTASTQDDRVQVRVCAKLCDAAHQPTESSGQCTLHYTLTAEGLLIEGAVSSAYADSARYILPVISPDARVCLMRGSLADSPSDGFCLSPGFACRAYCIGTDVSGRFALCIRADAG